MDRFTPDPAPSDAKPEPVSCRACLCRAQTGGEPAPVAYRIAWPGLSREEKTDGWLLPCCAYARADLVIDAPDATLC